MPVLKQTKRLAYPMLCKRKMLFFLRACVKIPGVLGSLPASGGRQSDRLSDMNRASHRLPQSSLRGETLLTKLPYAS